MKKTVIVFIIAFILAFCHTIHASSKDLEKDKLQGKLYEEAKSTFSESDRATLQAKTDKALNNLIYATIGELRIRGHEALAGSIEMDWNSRFKGFVYSFTPGRPVGDHEAIKWLLKIHDDVEFIIGKEICKSIRLHDLWTLAYTIPVVFSCIDHVDSEEYKKHFVPFSGIVSYWISYGICTGLSFGTGIVFACGLIGMGVEEITVTFIAPPLSNGFYKKACK